MRIHTALEKRTDVLSKVETFLVSLGVMDQSTLGVLPVMPVSGAQAKVDPKEDDDDLFGDGPGCEQGAKQETPDANGGTNGVGELVITREEQRWDKNWTHVGTMSPSMLEKTLSRMKPQIFTLANMKSIRKSKQAKTAPFSRLLQYFEYLTGKDAKSFIDYDLRDEEVWFDYCIKLMNHLGSRGDDLVIEPCEEDQWHRGVYSKERRSTTKLFVSHCSIPNAGKTVEVPKGVDDLFFHANFSETKCHLKSFSSSFSKPMLEIFANNVAARREFTRPQHRPKKATKIELSDNGTETACTDAASASSSQAAASERAKGQSLAASLRVDAPAMRPQARCPPPKKRQRVE